MSFEFAHPLRLLLIPLCAAVIAAIALIRRSRSLKEKVSHILRYIIVILAVLALSGMSLMTASPDRAAWLVVDVSASVNQEENLTLARQALEASGEGRRNGVIVYGRNAAVERALSEHPALREIYSRIDRDGSDLGEALELAAALLPADANGGIAVISDGLVTGSEEYLTTNRGIPVNTLKTERTAGPDAQVTDVSVPASLYSGQKYTTMVTVHSNTAGEATLALTENHGETRTRTVTLRKGENTFAFESVAASGGVIPCEARIILPGDTVSANDMNGAYTTVTGGISVLIAEGRSGEGEELRKMLESVSMSVRVIPASMISEDAAELWAYHAVALVNVDADQLTEGQMDALDRAARETGVGIAVFGGDSSYALGGYRGSALEKMLPVTIDVRNKLDLPTTALVLAIDKSGSMMDGSWGVTRLELAREAACSALEVLNERDQAGVIAFDDTGKWVVTLQNVTDVAAMQNQVRTIRLGGGTAFYSPMKMALEALRGANAQYKHVIFLSDGEAGDTGYQDVAREMADAGITLTTVAVGDGADYAGLKQLAETGGGRMYAAGPFDSLPKIFTKETMMISGSYVQNRTFTPAVTDASMTDFDGFPVLTGYLATTEKPLATVSLCSDRQDPILAWWQYGAGKVAAWTSDVRGGWTASFLNWDGAAEFFGGIISWILPAHDAAGESLLADGKLRYVSNAAEDILAEASRAEARIVRPDGSTQTVMLEQTSASGFEGEADTALPGAYSVRITLLDRQGHELLSADSGAVVSWTREYDLRGTEDGQLERLSAETGGQAEGDPAKLLSFPDTAARKRKELTGPLMILAALIFLFDIAQRRLDWIREPAEKPAAEKKPERKEKKKPEMAEKTEQGPQAADVLWQNLQKKKRL
ncbi:MAG: VWA domain-containing protein [Clostridiales bacterium]|nr:VWA domain-containing protein [Clostridiales bacterium]